MLKSPPRVRPHGSIASTITARQTTFDELGKNIKGFLLRTPLDSVRVTLRVRHANASLARLYAHARRD